MDGSNFCGALRLELEVHLPAIVREGSMVVENDQV